MSLRICAKIKNEKSRCIIAYDIPSAPKKNCEREIDDI